MTSTAGVVARVGAAVRAARRYAEPAGVITSICFHGVGEPPTALEPDSHEYFVSVDLFLAVLDEAAARPWVSLTFDDGYASDVEVALPALRERGLTATFFPVGGKLGQPGYLDAVNIRALSAAGMPVGSHGMWHRSWRDLDAQAEYEELVVARSLIGSAAQAPVRAAACPFGWYDRRALGALRRHGYEQVFTSDRRRARVGFWLQPRYSILRSDTLGSIRENILAPRPVTERVRCAAAARVKAWR
jgi:peptidoglycan/xylan/chitin deacetylase (PgdA/CDA1 family)